MSPTIFIGAAALAAASFIQGAVAGTLPVCSANSSISCTSGSASCCYQSPGGLVLQTQFWDTNPVTGPTDSWTIHGLWPDNCDGSYQENCDSSRDYTDITQILDNNGKSSLVTYLKTYMVSNDESAEDFWEHEWATHGTCYNTIDPSCYQDYTTGEEAADFFQEVANLFKTLDTYSALSAAGITPSSSKTYTLSQIQTAAAKIHNGKIPLFSCSSGELSQAAYYFHVSGNIISGTYYPVDSRK
jgi:ribonuclease T2